MSVLPNLFASVPEKDFLSLYGSQGQPDYKKVIDFLNFKKKDVAVAVRISQIGMSE